MKVAVFGARGRMGSEVVRAVEAAAGLELVAAVDAGDLATARRIHTDLIPITEALMNTSQGAIMAKAALKELGVIEHASVRLPYLEGPPEHLEKLRAALASTDLS